ncbi:MAG: VOC family protein [SAR202 cluster bacterium]|nr:VOC family protein [SAR202 cluster bacterium]|tara:strand:+ start:3279 stop:3779 length:501 start_codon:yes stop_codon:yes gene_type:complete
MSISQLKLIDDRRNNLFNRVDHLEILVSDVKKSVGFYTRVLGFERARWTIAHRDYGDFEQACVVLNGFMIELIQNQQNNSLSPDSPLSGIKAFALRVDDMQEAVKYLKNENVQFTREPKPGGSFDGLRAEIVDPDGTGIELREWKNGDDIGNSDWKPSDPLIEQIN